MLALRLALLCPALAAFAGVVPSQQAFLDKHSAYPGETVTLFATSTVNYLVSVKRSFSFNENPEVLRSPGLPAQTQPTPNVTQGSYAWAPTSPLLDIRDAITLEAWVKPIMGSRYQGIVTKYGVPGDASYMIYLLPTNQVSFYLGKTGAFNIENRLATRPLSLNRWTHIVATWDGQTKRVYLDGKLDVSRAWTGPIYRNSEPVRVAAYGIGQGRSGEHFTGHVDSPAIYNRALTPAEIVERFAERANYNAGNPGVLNGCVAQWNFGEFEGRVLSDDTGNGHDLTLVNNATRSVAGPLARINKTDSHSIRFAEDDLFDLNWEPSWSFTIPTSWRAGFYTVDFAMTKGGYRIPFVVKPLRAARTKIAVLVATATWAAYNGWSGNSMYNSHESGAIAYYVGLQQPNPNAAAGAGSRHLTDAERYLYWWLWREGYEFDLYTDFDLHRDPTLLDDYDVLMLNGHSEYWSHEMMNHTIAFQDAGGSVVNLSGNTMWTLVSFNPDFTVIEGRKHPHGSGTVPASERWHSTAGAPLGGTLRCIGRPEHEIIGTGYGIGGGGAAGWGLVLEPNHWVYAGTGVKQGDTFGKNGLNGPMMGYEVDVIEPQWTPSNVEIIGIGQYPSPTFQLGITNCQSRTSSNTVLGGEIIYYDHPGGGGVFGIASVTVGGTLLTDAVASKMVSNVLDRFLGTATCSSRNGSGVNPIGFECATAPVLGATWASTVATTAQTTATMVALSGSPAKAPFLGGEILIGLVPAPLVQSSNGMHAIPIPNLSSLAGANLYTQGFRIDQSGGGAEIVMLNAQDLTLGT